ncbi:MAG: hypothetical protein J7L52_07470 [Thermotogae bacterium]|nr:hypothetical protein [Thermotogota bacterium]
MKWKKRGLIFPTGIVATYASLPTVLKMQGNVFRVFYASRDRNNISSIYHFEVTIENGRCEILKHSKGPVLTAGRLATFDEHGVTPSMAIYVDGKIYLYYTGWQRWNSVPFNFAIGLAISEDGGTFKRYREVPIIDRNEYSPFLIASPFVICESGIFRMWYVGGVKWESYGSQGEDGIKHYYNIRYAESMDGIRWTLYPKPCIDFRYENEYAIARPVVLKENGVYKMWFSYRAGPKGSTYRIGYAESKDGIHWVRKDEFVGIDVSKVGWDSEMICYAYVIKHENKKYMFYNGNGYGRTGIGYAVLEEE